jgi:hypothetical protein
MKKCKFKKCCERVIAKDMCHRHYHYSLRNGLHVVNPHRETCEMKNCGKKHFGKGLCHMHYIRKWIHGDPRIVIKQPNGSGAVYQSYGTKYRKFNINGRQVLEHVLIAERVLGRRLKKPEQVHHFDGNGLNNKNKNLIICPNMAYHKLLHKRQRDAEKRA